MQDAKQDFVPTSTLDLMPNCTYTKETQTHLPFWASYASLRPGTNAPASTSPLSRVNMGSGDRYYGGP